MSINRLDHNRDDKSKTINRLLNKQTINRLLDDYKGMAINRPDSGLQWRLQYYIP